MMLETMHTCFEGPSRLQIYGFYSLFLAWLFDFVPSLQADHMQATMLSGIISTNKHVAFLADDMFLLADC
jgi:hypothetical protein